VMRAMQRNELASQRPTDADGAAGRGNAAQRQMETKA